MSKTVRGQISYDLVMDDNMPFVEGTYRLPGRDWQVFIFSKLSEVAEAQVAPTEWHSGVSGIFVRFPRSETLNAAVVERLLSDVLGVGEWETVRGPDSMQLR